MVVRALIPIMMYTDFSTSCCASLWMRFLLLLYIKVIPIPYQENDTSHTALPAFPPVPSFPHVPEHKGGGGLKYVAHGQSNYCCSTTHTNISNRYI